MKRDYVPGLCTFFKCSFACILLNLQAEIKMQFRKIFELGACHVELCRFYAPAAKILKISEILFVMRIGSGEGSLLEEKDDP